MIEKPILPDNEGAYACECDQKFYNIFEFLAHNGVKYEWGVRISPKWSFDMFEFMESIDNALATGAPDEIYEIVQSAALTMVNSSEGKFMEFMEEATVAGEMESIYEGIEKLLKKEKGNQRGE